MADSSKKLVVLSYVQIVLLALIAFFLGMQQCPTMAKKQCAVKKSYSHCAQCTKDKMCDKCLQKKMMMKKQCPLSGHGSDENVSKPAMVVEPSPEELNI